MNGLSPLMSRSEPAGRGGARRAGAGKRTADLAVVTLERSVRTRPAIRLTAPAATATELVTRKLRRSGCPGAPGCGPVPWPGRRGGPPTAIGRHGFSGPVSFGPAGVSGAYSGNDGPGEGGAGAPAPVRMGAPVPVRALMAGPPAGAAGTRTSRSRAITPAVAPSRVGRTSASSAPGLVSAATRPITAKTASPARP